MDTTFSQNNIFGDSFLNSKWFNPEYLFSHGLELFRQIFDYVALHRVDIISTYHGILFFLSMFFLIIIAYTCIRLLEIRKKEHHHLAEEIAEYAHHQAEKERSSNKDIEISTNPRWVTALKYLSSENINNWKLAIIEADSMLEDLLAQLGFKGETLGDRLKSADPEKFRSLSSAWEVHTIRNRIAHEGVAFNLSKREAQRSIAIYEQIFRQYGFI